MVRSSGLSTIVMADPFWRNRRHVQVGELGIGSRVNGTARLSCRMRAPDAHLLGFDDLLGRWLWVATPVGYFAYMVEDTPSRIVDQTIELSCVDMGAFLDFAITPRTYRQSSGTAGALIARAIDDSGSDEHLPYDTITCDEDGPPVTIEWRGDITGRVVQSLATNAGGMWTTTTDANRKLTFTYLAKPINKRGSIILVEGHNVIDGSVKPSLSGRVNDLLGIGNDRDWQRASGSRVIDGDAVIRYGRRRGVKRYVGHTRRSSLEAVARADLDELARPAGPVSLEMSDHNPTAWDIREGYVCRLWSATQNRRYELTVTGRAWDATRGIVTIVGSVIEEA